MQSDQTKPQETLASVSPSDVQTFIKQVEQGKAKTFLSSIHRAEILPLLFKVRGQAYSLRDYPQFRVIYDREVPPDTVFMCGRQLGKSAGINDLCLKANGEPVKLGDINVGDTLLSLGYTERVEPRKVTNKFDHGIQYLQRVRTRLGSVFHITPSHRLRTLYGYIPLNQLNVNSRIASIRRGGVFTNKCKHTAKRIVFTAYIIGDGRCTREYASFVTGSQEVRDDFKKYDIKVHWRSLQNPTVTVCHIPSGPEHPDYRKWLIEDGLQGKYSYQKTIPSWVFDLSRRNTALFVSRLWATDGSVKLYKVTPQITYTSTSEHLIYQLNALLLKLNIRSCIRRCRRKPNSRHKRTCWSLRIEGEQSARQFLTLISVPGKPTFTLKDIPRYSRVDTLPLEANEVIRELFAPIINNKQGNSLLKRYRLLLTPNRPLTRVTAQRYLVAAIENGLTSRPGYDQLKNIVEGDVIWDTITEITPVPAEQTYDLEIERNHNFVLAGGVVTHNSMNLSRSEVLDMLTIPHFQLLYVAPLQQQTQRYSTLYLSEAIKTCPLALSMQSLDEDDEGESRIVKSVHHQSLSNGAGIQLTYAKTSSDRARGIYADRIDFDEIQDQLIDNVPIITESLTGSNWGIRRFTGTAKTKDNAIEHLWQRSAQSEWVMKCEGCNRWNIPTEENKILDMIQSDGIHCVDCGKRLNCRAGQWVAAYPERKAIFQGYHIPQIVVPAIVENPVKWSRLIRKILGLPLPLIMQEVLGVSSSIGARIITQADIDRQSVLPSVLELQEKLRGYILTVGGLDWGGAENQSFTVHTIIGVRSDGRIDVLWARRYMGFNPDEQLIEIARAHRFYKCAMLAADFGMGFDKNIMLEQRFGIPMVQIALLRQNKLLSYNPYLGHHRWTVDKTTALELLFLAIKYGRVFFPPQSEFKIYTEDLLSPYEEVSEAGGLTYRHFLRNPNRPDDFCMALCFGTMLAMRLINSSIIDLVPSQAFGASESSSGAPAIVDVDPNDVIAALKM